MNYMEALEEMKSGGCSSSIGLDILRVLINNFGKIWKSELPTDLSLFREQAGRKKIVSEEDFEKALNSLENKKLIECNDRLKATREGGKPDSLISLTDLKSALDVFSDDRMPSE